jgi:hypothetical protein
MLKPICEAGEKISLRGQSIRFLQEVGRTLSAGTRESRVIFDYCNNVFRQGINKVLTEDQMIDAFRLNPCQNLLAETYRTMSAKIPPRGQLTAEYGKLVQILNILRKYYSPLHADIINGNLDHVLDRAEFIEHRDTIEQEINELDLFRARRNLCSYPIAQNLRNARKLLNSKKGNENAGIGFSTFNIKELAELGIFDRISQEGLNDYKDGCIEIDDNGFGVQSIIGFVLQIYFIIYHKLYPVLFLDEAFSTLSLEYIPYLKSLINSLSEKYNFIFVLITHDTRFMEISDKTYKVKDGKVFLDTLIGGTNEAS